MEFTPTDQGTKFLLAPNTALTVGRQPQFQLTSAKVSRQHVELVCSDDGHCVTAIAHKKFEVEHGSTGTLTAVQAGRRCQLLPGDTIYLEREGAQLKSGFTLSGAAGTADAPTASSVRKPKRPSADTSPAAKRVKADPSAAAAPPGQPGRPQKPGSFSAEAADGAADMFSPVKRQELEQQQVFAGVQLAVWDQHHTQKAVALAVQAGAKVKLYIDSSTTHVIACYSMSGQEAEKQLQYSQQHQQASHRTSSSLSGSQGSIHVNRQLQFSMSQPTAALQSSGSQQQQLHEQQDGREHEHERLHELMSRIHFVTVKWLTDSLAAGNMLPEHSYHIQLHQNQYRLPRTGSSMSRRQQLVSQGPVEQHQQQPQPGSTAGIKLACDTQGAQPPVPLGNNDQQEQVASQVPQQHGLQQPWQSRWNNIPPTADQICRPGEEWGAGGRWIEPWDEAAALDTVDQLLSHWHRVQSNKREQRTAKAAAASAAAAAQEGSPDAEDAGISDGLSSDDGGQYSDGSAAANRRAKRRLQRYQSAAAAAEAALVNGVCSHTACSRQAFCFVAEMETLKSTYSRGREDQFRIKAANRAIHELEKTDRPLVITADVTSLGLGDKTTDKLLEILQTGKLRRNDEVAGSERHRVMALFMGVWGVAECTAEKWFQAGCKSVQDVRDKIDHLTAQQRVGLKFYDDFEQRIPRDEVTEAENIVYDLVADALQELTGKRRSEVTHLMHARVTGSYLRGRQTCGDIDFIIAPGPACANLVGLGALMEGIVDRLAAKQYITQVRKCHAGTSSAYTMQQGMAPGRRQGGCNIRA
eukprot:GHUV01015968.1.p1 GENE.GHUV01015968.1~~GHUV01015968.1.p1  ORF type:complete len:808 (+),score=308.86 GHUV01015968.1:556-2979(+)